MKPSSTHWLTRKRRLPIPPLFTLRALRRIVIGLAWTATIIVLLYSVENWRCRRAWERYRRAAEARGEHLDFAYFIPKPIPDERNFAMAGSLPKTLFNPDFHKWPGWKNNFSLASYHLKSPGAIPYDKQHFHFIDLAAWKKALDAHSAGGPEPDLVYDRYPDLASRAAAAPDVLLGLQDSEPVIEEMLAASSRPEARYPVDYNVENPAKISLPFYGQLQSMSNRLRLKACAELALGRNEDAMKDLNLMFYLSNSMANEPFLISLLVRNSLLAIQSQVIWEGLAGHCWSDLQLQEIQKQLLSRDLITEALHTFDCERACELAMAEYYGTKKNFNVAIDDLESFFGGSKPDPSTLPIFVRNPRRFLIYYSSQKLNHFLIWLMPREWYHLEQIDYLTRFQARFQSVFDPSSKRIFPRRLESNILSETPVPKNDLEALLQHRLFSSMMVKLINAVMIRKHVAGSQCNSDEAAIACALERYRLAKGTYPNQLDALVPAFIPALPHDALTGGPYCYRLDSPSLFTLYSVGWDLKDDGGKPGANWYDETGDWVW